MSRQTRKALEGALPHGADSGPLTHPRARHQLIAAHCRLLTGFAREPLTEGVMANGELYPMLYAVLCRGELNGRTDGLDGTERIDSHLPRFAAQKVLRDLY